MLYYLLVLCGLYILFLLAEISHSNVVFIIIIKALQYNSFVPVRAIRDNAFIIKKFKIQTENFSDDT